MGDRDIQIIIQAIDKTGSAINSIGKNLSWLGGSFTKVAVQISATKSAVTGALALIGRTMETINTGIQSHQAEESFRSVAASANENADRIVEAMDRAANGTIDKSELMQKAVKGITQGLKGNELVQLTEAARVASRTAGKDVGIVFDEIIDSVANKTPRALKEMGLVTKEQMNLFEQAVRVGVEEVSLLEIVLANAAVRQAQFGVISENNIEKFQRFKAELADIKENIGKGLMWSLQKIYGGFQWIAAGALAAAAYIVKFASYFRQFSAWVEEKSGNKGEADKQRQSVAAMQETFEALKRTSEDLTGKAMETWTNENPAAAIAIGTRKSLPEAQAALDELTDKIRAAIEKSKIKPEKSAKAKTSGKTSDVDSPVYDTEKGVRAFQEYEQSLTEIRATETEKRLAKTEEWATREYGLLKIAYANNVIGEKEYSDRLLEIQSETESQKQQIKADAEAEAAEIRQKAQEDESKALEAYQEEHGTMWEGIVEGMKRYTSEMKTNFQQGLDMASQITSGMESAFISFFDTTSEKFMDFGELAKSILQTIYMELVKTLIIKQVMAGIGGMFHEGGVVMHAGGLVGRSGSEGGFVPRYHVGGLASDERPAILQTGEGVLSRRGMANLGALNAGAAGGGVPNVVINVENKSSMPLDAKQGQMKFDGKLLVTSIILSDLASYGPIRNAFAGIK